MFVHPGFARPNIIIPFRIGNDHPVFPIGKRALLGAELLLAHLAGDLLDAGPGADPLAGLGPRGELVLLILGKTGERI